VSAAEAENPWVLQNVLLDRKVERFRVALEKIAARKPIVDEMTSDRALATLQEVTTIACAALDQ
jgi:hypothetical protein